jgi:hypothetical protein
VIRVIRPLRIISYNERLRIAAKALAHIVPGMINVTVVLLIFLLLFGMVCIKFLKGQFFECINPVQTLETMIDHKWTCINSGGEWIRLPNHFDSIDNAVMVLSYSASLSGWSEIMFTALTATDVDYVMNGSNYIWCAYFIFFMVVSSFFLVNLFVGIVIMNYNREKNLIEGNHRLSPMQKEWLETRLTILKSKPILLSKIPENRFR